MVRGRKQQLREIRQGDTFSIQKKKCNSMTNTQSHTTKVVLKICSKGLKWKEGTSKNK